MGAFGSLAFFFFLLLVGAAVVADAKVDDLVLDFLLLDVDVGSLCFLFDIVFAAAILGAVGGGGPTS